MTRTRETAIAVTVGVVSVVSMAIDHMIGNEDDGDDSWAVDPSAFVISTAIALAVTVALFRVVVAPARNDPDRAGKRALLCGAFAVVSLPLLFLALPFPFAGAAVALGLIGREGRRRRIATAALVIGALVLVLGLGGYLTALVDS